MPVMFERNVIKKPWHAFWWLIGMAHEHRRVAAIEARAGNWDEAGWHYGKAHGCYDDAERDRWMMVERRGEWVPTAVRPSTIELVVGDD